MCVITIENIESETIIGVEEHERTHLTPVIATVVIRYDSSKAETSDDINDAVSYLDVYQLVKNEMSEPSHLIENVAYRIKKAVGTQYPQARDIKVRLYKLNPPLGGQVEKVCVEL